MICRGAWVCPDCGGQIKFRGKVKRILRTKGGAVEWIEIRRVVCEECGKIHRELPDCLFPHKHYAAEIIRGVSDGTITADNLDYEDRPCEATMERWKKEFRRKK
jgi:DNA-directed RNA polymerase subunit RPC12/RpoP